jgi:hypothetical protein
VELSKEDLIVIFEALEEKGGEAELMDAIANELEIMELAEVEFDEDDGCAGGACKL